LQGAAKIAADKTAAATAGQDQAAAGQTMYAQVKANIDKLDKKGKQRILQLLQKSMAAPAAAPAKPAAAPAAAPTAAPAAPAAEPKKRAPKKQAAPAQTQAEIDADRERIMGVTSDSIVRRQPMMAEGFSLFRKRT
jgi:hypothetical protein